MIIHHLHYTAGQSLRRLKKNPKLGTSHLEDKKLTKKIPHLERNT